MSIDAVPAASVDNVLTAPIETHWQTLSEARGKRAAAVISSHPDKTLFGDDFFKALYERYWKLENENRRAALYSTLFLFVLFIARYAPITEVTWAGIKVTEVKGFSEVLLFLSSVLAIYVSLLNTANHMRRQIIVACIKLRAGEGATTFSTAYLDNDLIAHAVERDPDQFWWGSPALAIVGLAVGVAVFALGLAGLLSVMRLIVIFDIASEIRLPPILHYTVIVTSAAAVLFGILSVVLIYFPWPYTDYKNADAFYALRSTDPEKFRVIFSDWSKRQSKREVLRDRMAAAFIFFVGFLVLQFLVRNMDSFLSASVVMHFILAIALVTFIGGGAITMVNRKIGDHLYATPPTDNAAKLRRYKIKKWSMRVTTLIIPISFAILFFFLPSLRFS